jgi:threonine dehydrogenase-like Zn-dependent dehydrogenase
VPNADATVVKAPPEINDQSLVLMADIFPTGYFGAKNAFSRLSAGEIANGTVVVVGCGPVGLCAIIAALEYKPKHLFAVDSVDSRLEEARKLGAEPLNFVKDKEGMFEKVKSVTEGRGADAVIEVVGLSPALRTAFDLLRPWGVISSIGVHNAEVGPQSSLLGNRGISFADDPDRSPGVALRGISESALRCGLAVSVLTSNSKNVRLQMGRCPVRSLFPEALALLAKSQDKLR